MGYGKHRNAICYCKDGALNKRKYKNCCMMKDQGFIKDEATGSWRVPTQVEYKKLQKARIKEVKSKLKEMLELYKKSQIKQKEMEKTKEMIKSTL